MISSSSFPEQFRFWLNFMSDQNPLLSPTGTSLWTEGVERLRALSTLTFLKSPNSLTPFEIENIGLIEQLMKFESRTRDFDVIGDLTLSRVSPTYRSIRERAETSGIRYSFVAGLEGSFCPWENRVELGTKFYKVHEGRIKVPFYSFNHENAHLALFRKYYSNLDIDDSRFSKLLILIEWFCISMDFVIAYDLIRSGCNGCLAQLESIAQDKNRFLFAEECKSLESADAYADLLRRSFLSGKTDIRISRLISSSALEKHRLYARSQLMSMCRRVPSRLQRSEIETALISLENRSLTGNLHLFTGIRHEN